MNYDERMKIILNELIKVLSIYEIPRSLNSEKQQNDHIQLLSRSINDRFPNDTTLDHIVGTFERVAIKLSAIRKTNTWPSNDAIIKAVTASMGGSKSQVKNIENDVETAARILNNTGRAHQNMCGTYIAKQLIKRGLLKDERDAHWRGFDMFGYKEQYLNQRMTIDEWENHISVLANMCNITKDEAEERELFGHEALLGPINSNVLPEELLPRLGKSSM